MFKEAKKFIFISLFIIGAFSIASFALAQAPDLGLDYGRALNLPTADPRVAAMNLIRLALTFVGIIAVLIILYGGYLWMTSAGEAQKIDKAKKVLLGAIIGLIIILSAFLIVSFVANRITGALSGGCTPAATRGCGCGDMGSQTCQADRTWGPCTGGSCTLPEGCCSGGFCAADCSVPPVFIINSTSPGGVNVPLNTKIRFTFNRNVDDATVDDTTFTVASGTLTVAGARTVSGRRIEFTPAASCPVGPGNPCGATNCFDAGSNITVTAVNGAGGILSVGGIPLTCGLTNPCTISFTVGDRVDCQDPNVALDFDQICVSPDNNIYALSSDDSGIDRIEFFVNGASVPDSPVGNNPVVNPGADSPFNTRSELPSALPSVWDGSGYAAGDAVELRATAYDLDANSASANRTINLRAAHCCNGEFDDMGDPDLLGGPAELGADCGGECAGCDGAACGTSMDDDCVDTTGVDCRANDDRCASRFCNCGGDAASCGVAGYASGVDDCCICQNTPIIDWITPQGGFCRDASSTPTNTVCRRDTDCAAVVPGPGTCDTQTANGAPGNLVTIGGRYFGIATGTVDFSGTNARLANMANPACVNSWSDNQIVVEVPGGIPAGPVVRVVAASALSDTTDNARGPIVAFVTNTIRRPGICLLSPDHGRMNTLITYEGINILNNTAYFGNSSGNVAALFSAFGSAFQGTARVPNLSTGRTTSFVTSPAPNNAASNYLYFTKDAEAPAGPYIISFSPIQGPHGQYLTILGGGFGASRGGSRVFFGATSTGVEAGYDFPAICADSVWSDNQVIVKAPDMGAGDLDIPITMVIGSWTINTSLLAQPTFGYRPGMALAPSLCRIRPVMGPNLTPISLWGEYFGAGPGAVRFHLMHDQGAAFISFWGPTGTAEMIKTTVHPLAVTGPVKVAIGAALDNVGNGLNFRVGNCTSEDDCGGTTCCPSGSYRVGQCAVNSDGDSDIDLDDCYITGASSVFEWDFSTAAGSSTIGQPCYVPLSTCNPLNPTCSGGLVCDPGSCTCQLPCDSATSTPGCQLGSCPPAWSCNSSTCFCVADSCRARSRYLGSCDPYFCPNTPGQCSYNVGATTTVSDCSNAVCNGLGACTVPFCVYNDTLDKCVNPTIPCDLARADVTGAGGNTLTRYCALYNGNPRWHVNTAASCPTSTPVWTRITGDRCVDAATPCNLCDTGYSCLAGDGGTGVCAVSTDICPGTSACNTATGNCEQNTRAQCECCCEIGEDARDCCSPLTCDWMCGADTNPGDSTGFGLCSGCADATVPDAACNCTGHTNQYCDLTTGPDKNGDGSPDGVCRDCSYIGNDPTECGLHDTCCTDAININNCRGGDGTALAGGFCPYYNCEPVAPFACNTTATTTGTYRTEDQCDTGCGVSPYGPQGGESCFDTASGTCALVCASPYLCLGQTGCFDMNPSPPPPACAGGDTSCTCCCDTAVSPDPCASLGLSGLNCIAKEPCLNGNRGLCCGCVKDPDCVPVGATPDTVGCSSDTCCRARPNVSVTDPADNAVNVCRNVKITAEFDQLMDLGSFSGNVILAGDYGSGACPAGTRYLALDSGRLHKQSALARISIGVWRSIVKALEPILPARLARAYTIPSSNNYCAVSGVSGGYHMASLDRSVLEFSSSRLLDGNRLYYLIIKGDNNLTNDNSEGVLSRWGVGMNASGVSPSGGSNTFNGIPYANAYAWSFRTLPAQTRNNGVCALDHVDLIPSSYLFQTTVNSSFEVDGSATDVTFDTVRDSDKLFVARALGANGQTLSPVPGEYNWSWGWSSSNPVIATSVNGVMGLSADKALVRTGIDVVGGRTVIAAAATITTDNYFATSTVGTSKSDSADVYVMICENPWPPISPGPVPPAGTWRPWRDDTEGMGACLDGPCRNTNYEIYYCRDAGRPGTQDDLPAILSNNTVIRGQTASMIKEAYFFRENVPTATSALTIVNNPGAEDGGSVNLSWAGADSYKLYWGRSRGSYPNYIDAGSVTSSTLNGLTNGQIYYFNITAYYNTGAESEYWGEVSFTPRDVNPPDVPAGFTAVAGDREVELSWSAAVGASSYEVYYGLSAGAGFGYARNIGNDTAVVIAGLTNGNSYRFAVASVDSAGNQATSTTLSDIRPFAAPTGLSVSAASTTTVDLRWNLNGTGASITVEWGIVSGIYTGSSPALGGTLTAYQVTGLISNTTYYFIVRSTNGTETQSSQEVSGKTLNP